MIHKLPVCRHCCRHAKFFVSLTTFPPLCCYGVFALVLCCSVIAHIYIYVMCDVVITVPTCFTLCDINGPVLLKLVAASKEEKDTWIKEFNKAHDDLTNTLSRTHGMNESKKIIIIIAPQLPLRFFCDCLNFSQILR